jgi:hypothetical protein
MFDLPSIVGALSPHPAKSNIKQIGRAKAL